MLGKIFSMVGAALAVGGLCVAPAHAATQTIISVDFDNPGVLAPGVVNNSTGNGLSQLANGGPYLGSNGKSWSGLHASFFDTELVTVSLANLPVHTSLTVDFLLGFLNSWDSTDGNPAPDYLNISIEGGPVIQLTTISSAGGTVVQYQGGTLLVDNGQIDQSVFFSDDLVDMGSASFLTFAHTASTLTMTIQAGGSGWQGGLDEYWGFDAFSITAVVPGDGTVPEPGVPALLAGALLAAAWARRARQRRPGAGL